jgi:hypothetical protein
MNTDKGNHTDILPNRRLKLGTEGENENTGIKTDLVAGEPVAMVTYDNTVPEGQEIEGDSDRKKRSKKEGANSTSQGSAASREESGRNENLRSELSGLG